MRQVMRKVQAVAQADSSVLILGESGVGKELVAAAVHDRSRRRDGPFVKVNCASVPRELFESEFFGHVRGAFSGASRDRQGRFLLADGGSLFLDEVGEIPLELQGKLLRVLQERTFEAVGDDRTRHVDVRVIAATNRPLEAEVERGRFRRDLFYRLSVLPIEVPPLRERRADILPMAERFLRTAAEHLHLPPRSLSDEERNALLAYDFPGNVRELQNIIERAMVLEPTGRSALAREIGQVFPLASGSAAVARPAERPANGQAHAVIAADDFRTLERDNLVNALARCGWQVAGPGGAAVLLGLSPSTLAYRMKRLGIERPR
jgi:transcriptional regulator with GAF, ATPase, and Fis domain